MQECFLGSASVTGTLHTYPSLLVTIPLAHYCISYNWRQLMGRGVVYIVGMSLVVHLWGYWTGQHAEEGQCLPYVPSSL